MIGETVASYRIVAKLGRGGMGEVFIAEHPVLGRRAAVKFIRPELSANPENLNRFFNEARAATLVQHPGIVDVFDYGLLPSGSAFFVMEFLEGETLAGRVRNGRLTRELLVPVFDQIADALGAAHAKGIIHRDLKPDNVFLVPDRAIPCGLRVKVLDFGIAKLANPSRSISPMTESGSVLGTPAYMSPEQCSGARHVDFRTDIYSLGCMLYEAASGRLPFPAPGLGEMLAAHLYLTPPQLRTLDPTISPALERIVDRALAKAPETRQQSMAEVQAELAALGAHGASEKVATPTGSGPTTALGQPSSTVWSLPPQPRGAAPPSPSSQSPAAPPSPSSHSPAVMPSGSSQSPVIPSPPSSQSPAVAPSPYGVPAVAPPHMPPPSSQSPAVAPPQMPPPSYGVPVVAPQLTPPPSHGMPAGPPPYAPSSYGASPPPQSPPYGVPAPPSQPYGMPAPPSQPYGMPAPQSQPYGVPAPPSQPYGMPAPQSQPYGVPAPQSQPYGVPAAPYGAPASYGAASPLTTLSAATGASSHIAGAGRGRRWAIALAGVALGAGAVAAVFLLRGGDAPAPAPAPAQVAAVTPSPAPSPPAPAPSPPPVVPARTVTTPAEPPPASAQEPAHRPADDDDDERAPSRRGRREPRPRSAPADTTTAARPTDGRPADAPASAPAPAPSPATAASPPATSPPATSPPAASPPATSRPAATPSAGGDRTSAEQLYDRAAARYSARDYAGAIQLTQQLVKDPSASARDRRNGWLLMGQAYCYLRHRAGAYRAWTELPQADRDDLKSYCQRASISLP